MVTQNNVIQDPKIEKVLERLHAYGEQQEANYERPIDLKNLNWGPSQFTDMLLSVNAAQGALLYILARSIQAKTIVEFGTSHGVSSIYLAAALRDNRQGGKLIGTEFVAAKVKEAQKNLEEVSLSSFVEIREGDARETLKTLPQGIDLCLMDGFPPFSLEVFKLIAPKLRRGAIVISDDIPMNRELLAGYFAYLRDPQNGFRSVYLPLGDGTEISVKDM